MPIALSDFEIGDTTYVAKMNANNLAIRDYIVQNETSQANISSSALSVNSMQRALFGDVPLLFDDASYRTTAIGSDLMVSAGTAWAPSQNLIVQLLSGATVSMSGLPPGTYYLNAVNGTPLSQPVLNTTARDPLYSFVWSGSSISELTRLASVLPQLPRGPETLTYAATLSLNWTRTETIRLKLTGNATINSCSGAYDGQRCMLEVTQDSTGGRVLTLGTSSIKVGSDVTWSIDTSPNKRTRIGLVYVKPSSVYDLAAVARGF